MTKFAENKFEKKIKISQRHQVDKKHKEKDRNRFAFK